jgi:hypothetical protein
VLGINPRQILSLSAPCILSTCLFSFHMLSRFPYYFSRLKQAEKLMQMDRKRKPIENKSLYTRALECKEAINNAFRDMIDKNNKLIKDIELGRN